MKATRTKAWWMGCLVEGGTELRALPTTAEHEKRGREECDHAAEKDRGDEETPELDESGRVDEPAEQQEKNAGHCQHRSHKDPRVGCGERR